MNFTQSSQFHTKLGFANVDGTWTSIDEECLAVGTNTSVAANPVQEPLLMATDNAFNATAIQTGIFDAVGFAHAPPLPKPHATETIIRSTITRQADDINLFQVSDVLVDTQDDDRTEDTSTCPFFQPFLCAHSDGLSILFQTPALAAETADVIRQTAIADDLVAAEFDIPRSNVFGSENGSNIDDRDCDEKGSRKTVNMCQLPNSIDSHSLSGEEPLTFPVSMNDTFGLAHNLNGPFDNVSSHQLPCHGRSDNLHRHNLKNSRHATEIGSVNPGPSTAVLMSDYRRNGSLGESRKRPSCCSHIPLLPSVKRRRTAGSVPRTRAAVVGASSTRARAEAKRRFSSGSPKSPTASSPGSSSASQSLNNRCNQALHKQASLTQRLVLTGDLEPRSQLTALVSSGVPNRSRDVSVEDAKLTRSKSGKRLRNKLEGGEAELVRAHKAARMAASPSNRVDGTDGGTQNQPPTSDVPHCHAKSCTDLEVAEFDTVSWATIEAVGSGREDGDVSEPYFVSTMTDMIGASRFELSAIDIDCGGLDLDLRSTPSSVLAREPNLVAPLPILSDGGFESTASGRVAVVERVIRRVLFDPPPTKPYCLRSPTGLVDFKLVSSSRPPRYPRAD